MSLRVHRTRFKARHTATPRQRISPRCSLRFERFGETRDQKFPIDSARVSVPNAAEPLEIYHVRPEETDLPIIILLPGIGGSRLDPQTHPMTRSLPITKKNDQHGYPGFQVFAYSDLNAPEDRNQRSTFEIHQRGVLVERRRIFLRTLAEILVGKKATIFNRSGAFYSIGRIASEEPQLFDIANLVASINPSVKHLDLEGDPLPGVSQTEMATVDEETRSFIPGLAQVLQSKRIGFLLSHHQSDARLDTQATIGAFDELGELSFKRRIETEGTGHSGGKSKGGAHALVMRSIASLELPKSIPGHIHIYET